MNEPEGTGGTPGADGPPSRWPEPATGTVAGAPGENGRAWATGANGHGPPSNLQYRGELEGRVPGTGFLDEPGSVPATGGDAWVWVLYAVLGFAVGQIVGALLDVVSAVGEGRYSQLSQIEKHNAQPLWLVAPGLIGLWVGLAFAAFLATRTRGTGNIVRDLGLRFRWVDLWGVAIGVGSQFAIDGVYALLTHFNVVHTLTGPSKKLLGGAHGWEYAVIAVLTVFGAAFFEEMLFRGVLFRALARICTVPTGGPSRRRTWGLAVAVIVDGCLFGLAHWEPVQFAGLAAFGAVLAVVSYRTNRLGMNMVAHASFNAVAVISYVVTSGVIR